jgi:hypothetical protein
LPTLEDIKPGARLGGLDLAGLAEVAQVARFGADALNLVFKVAVYGEMLPRQPLRFLLADDPGAGKAILRDYIKATVGFEKLGEATGTQPKSLIRMFGPRGNPQARNLFGIIGYLQKQTGVELHVRQGQGCSSINHWRKAFSE